MDKGELREQVIAGLRKCRRLEGAPISLIQESDLHHISYMVTEEGS